jgi:hypothetical protein
MFQRMRALRRKANRDGKVNRDSANDLAPIHETTARWWPATKTSERIGLYLVYIIAAAGDADRLSHRLESRDFPS